MAQALQWTVLLVSLLAMFAMSDARRLLFNTGGIGIPDQCSAWGMKATALLAYFSCSDTCLIQSFAMSGSKGLPNNAVLCRAAAYGYQDTDPTSVQAYDSTSYQAQQQPVQQGSAASSNSDSLPSFELPSLPQIKAFFDSLPKPPSLGPGKLRLTAPVL